MMSTHTTYYPTLSEKQTSVEIIDPLEIKHLIKSLRMKEGDDLTIFNGAGLVAESKIEHIHKTKIITFVEKATKHFVDIPRLILCSAPPKKSKFELIIEKCAELGIHSIIPLQTERTEVLISEKNLDKKLSRFKSIALSAAKQSKQPYLTQIHPAMTLSEIFSQVQDDDLIVYGSLRPDALPALETFSTKKKVNDLYLFIGPEGDFTDSEIKLMEQHQAKGIRLTPSTLRVETAAIALTAIAKVYFCGINKNNS